MSKIMDFLKYGRQIGNVHSDGSVLRRGSFLFAEENIKTLLNKDGVVQKFIFKINLDRDSFVVVRATPVKNDHLERYNILKTYFCNNAKKPFIKEQKFIGEYFDGMDGKPLGWLPSPDCTNKTSITYFLKPRTK